MWKQHWDILYFAGHSCSNTELSNGEIEINDHQTIPLSRLRRSLETAVANGLKLAIFNSCNGLGLAAQLDSVGVPQMIVMQEPVPDEVARNFLSDLFRAFVGGKSFYLAVREACDRLEGMEDDYPCASWLPVICQTPNAEPLRWSKYSPLFLFWHNVKWHFTSLFSFQRRRNRIILALVLFSIVLISLIVLTHLFSDKKIPPSVIEQHVSQPVTNISSSKGEKFLENTIKKTYNFACLWVIFRNFSAKFYPGLLQCIFIIFITHIPIFPNFLRTLDFRYY